MGDDGIGLAPTDRPGNFASVAALDSQYDHDREYRQAIFAQSLGSEYTSLRPVIFTYILTINVSRTTTSKFHLQWTSLIA